ncbi:hypothetical protein GCM10010467_02380 [Actinocorallia glomerata]|uniref:Uncharacterized protein n=1 Tax=Actinocorallia glomerata TaxID=46203 RepID=A0ABP6P9E2_9ACTN
MFWACHKLSLSGCSDLHAGMEECARSAGAAEPAGGQMRLSVSRARRVPLNCTSVTRAIISTMATIITAVS